MTSSAHTGRLGLAGLCLLLLATGCTTLPAPDSAQAECLRLYQQTERVLTASGARPSSPAAIRGFPYYRGNRFLAAFRQQELDQAATDYWLQQLGQQEQDSRQIALRGLSDAQRARLPYPVGPLNQTMAQCQQTLRQFDLAHPERLAQLRQRAVVADDYVVALATDAAGNSSDPPVQTTASGWSSNPHTQPPPAPIARSNTMSGAGPTAIRGCRS